MRRKKLFSILCSKSEQKRVKGALKDPDELPIKEQFKMLDYFSNQKEHSKRGKEKG